MTRSCRINIAARATQWKHIGIESSLIYQILKEEIGAIQVDISSRSWKEIRVIEGRDDALLEGTDSVVTSIVGIIRSYLFSSGWGTAAVVVVEIMRFTQFLGRCRTSAGVPTVGSSDGGEG